MGKLTVSYNNNSIIDTTSDGSFTLATSGKLMADDVGVEFEGGVALTLEVNVDTGSAVTVTNGTTTLTGTSANNKCAFTLPEAGTWTASAEKDGQASSSDAKTYTTSQSVTLTYAVVARTTPQTGISYTNGISGLSASELNEIAMAISDNSDITYQTSEVYVTQYNRHISVGDQISYSLGGTSYVFRIMGFNHYPLSSAKAYGASTTTGCAGFLLQAVDCITEGSYHGSDPQTETWPNFYERTELQDTWLPKFPSATQNIIKEVSVGYKTSLSSGYSHADDKLFIPSRREVTGEDYAGTGDLDSDKRYAWYRANSSQASRVKKYNDTARDWLLRNPIVYSNYSTSRRAACVRASGYVDPEGTSGYDVTNNKAYVSPCFCI